MTMTEKEIAQWVVETCLSFGTTTVTAYKVAGLFVEGLNEKNDEEQTCVPETDPVLRCPT